MYELELDKTGEYIPTSLKLWEYPDSYYGDTHYGWYVFFAHHRDSDLITESNWECIIKEFPESDSIQIVRNSHWAVGWIEFIKIHKTDYENLKRADDILSQLENYLILNEEDYSARELESVNEYWEYMSLADRVKLCEKAGVNIFAARRAEYPSDADKSGRLYEYLSRD